MEIQAYFGSNEWISPVKLRESKLHTVAFYTRAMHLARMRFVRLKWHNQHGHWTR